MPRTRPLWQKSGFTVTWDPPFLRHLLTPALWTPQQPWQPPQVHTHVSLDGQSPRDLKSFHWCLRPQV